MTTLLLFAALQALLLGCDATTEPPEPSISGIVVVGTPIVDAVVFLDLDDDNVLDSSEPRAATGPDGTFTLAFYDEASFGRHAVVANVVPASSRPGSAAPIGVAVTLTAPPGRSDVVSPYTTLIASELVNDPALDEAGAEAQVGLRLAASTLVLSQPTPDLLGNPLAGPDAAMLGPLAEALAGILSAAVEGIDEEQDFVDPRESDYFHTMVVSVGSQLTAIADGARDFAALSAAEQQDVAENPSGYADYFVDSDALFDLFVTIVLGLADVAIAFAEWLADKLAEVLLDIVLDMVGTPATLMLAVLL